LECRSGELFGGRHRLSSTSVRIGKVDDTEIRVRSSQNFENLSESILIIEGEIELDDVRAGLKDCDVPNEDCGDISE